MLEKLIEDVKKKNIKRRVSGGGGGDKKTQGMTVEIGTVVEGDQEAKRRCSKRGKRFSFSS